MRNRFGFVFNGRVFLCEPSHYNIRGILLLGGQAFTAKTGKKIIEKTFYPFFVFLLIFRFYKQLEKFDTTILMYLLLLMYLLPVP